MTSSDFDSYRPPEPPRRGPKRRRRRGGPGRTDGSREMPMVPEAEFATYYDRPVVKAPPWEAPIGVYLFLGGVAGGSSLLAAGAQFSGNTVLRRNSRIAAIAAAGAGAVALIADLGRPERFLNMFRTFKVSSPMSVGSWILGAFSAAAGLAAAGEADRMTRRRLPLGPLRSLLKIGEPAGGVAAAVLGAPLAAYTGVLLGDTANPTWNAAKDDLSFVFVSSASLAAGGLGLITTPVAHARPARAMAVIGAAADLVASEAMMRRMDPVAAEPLSQGAPGTMLTWSRRLAALGGLGALLGGRNRVIAMVSGVALLAASALTRFGVLDAGLRSVEDPRYVIEPQKRRLQERQRQGVIHDSITTAG
ncbi:MAG TPA: NrfD/PsrC family molybdoenzyme membrane anchor subunit [Microbacterium sp.]|nr:NrfD/PsrC family molybdoenzyme membrane anchor subunit [Microbacterium sp.]